MLQSCPDAQSSCLDTSWGHPCAQKPEGCAAVNRDGTCHTCEDLFRLAGGRCVKVRAACGPGHTREVAISWGGLQTAATWAFRAADDGTMCIMPRQAGRRQACRLASMP